jgi:hypothetical protein
MIKKLLITTLILLACPAKMTFAQSYQWIKGGGSTELMSPSRNYERVTNMCTDEDGNVYITALVGATSILADTFSLLHAYNTYSSRPHILLASYKCDGSMRWAKLVESAESANAGGLAYNKGSIYLVGSLYGNNKHIGDDTTITSTYLQSFTSRFDTLGNFKWIRFVGTDVALNGANTGYPGTVAIDGQDYIHNFNTVGPGIPLTPSFTSDTTGTYDLKYDSLGNIISTVRIHLDSVWTITKAIYNKQDNKYFALLFPNESYWFTYYTNAWTAICAFQPNGHQVWMDTTNYNSVVNGFDYKGGNDIYVCGYANSPDTFTLGGISATDTIFHLYNIAVISRLDTNGVARWIYDLQSNESVDFLQDITILPGGKVAAAGKMDAISIHGADTLISTAGEFSNPLFLVVDSSGHTVKLDQFHGSGNDDAGYFITSDAIGNAYVGGIMDANMFATSLIPYLTHGGNTDFFLLKYGVDCSCTSAPIASYTDTGTHTIGVTYTGTTIGIDSVVWSFGDGGRSTGTTALHTFSVSGTYHVCVTVYTECGSDMSCSNVVIHIPSEIASEISKRNVKAYPNPANDVLNITGLSETAGYRLLNMTGMSVSQGILQQGSNTISMKDFATGVYILSLNSESGERNIVRVVKE